ncbi:MAG: 16S rRNA (cytosine(1402)-N(4))-methyltransferase RsmH [Desulfobacterota bacterium]|nr:16S rRNA (cytosine(1402)-N(4))-methyltransferase RsmH [Thermodesulfobacteriota bacterium]
MKKEREGIRHIPVMVEEVMALLRCEPGRIYVDGTLGGGGHAEEILRRTGPDGVVVGIDWDEKAIEEASRRLKPYGDRIRTVRENFTHLPEILKSAGIEEVDGILLDLGLSSLQIEDEARGFSFRGEGPLDMRMDVRSEGTAADLVNRLSVQELEHLLREYGEERWAKRIARAIVEERERAPIQTARDLSRIVYRAIPRRSPSNRIDPATRTFQALRLGVNRELENLKGILETGWRMLKQGGRFCILTFHSLEDRLVKHSFRRMEEEGKMRVLTKRPLTPSRQEVRMNPRARSAKLRCAERR